MVAAIVLCSAIGCATIARKTSQEWTVLQVKAAALFVSQPTPDHFVSFVLSKSPQIGRRQRADGIVRDDLNRLTVLLAKRRPQKQDYVP